jgi:hypothetical protein
MKNNHTNTITLLKQCIASSNIVTRSVYKEIIAKRLNCSKEFVQQTYLIGYGR